MDAGRSAATILVVDDEPLARQMLTDLLEAQGFGVIAVARGEDTFRWLDKVDLVLLDAMLPERDGWQICREIKERYDPLLPVIMVTARTAPDDVVRTFDAGADDYVAKPFHVAELTARIGSRLRVHRAELALKEAAEQARRDTEEREQLLKELDHRVRNNLAKITGLVSMARNRRPQRSAEEALANLESRLHSFLTVHDALRRQKYRGVPSRELIERVAQRLRNINDRDGRVQLDITAEPSLLDERQAFALALALNELISNALIHAFPGDARGTIAIRAEQVDGSFHLDVKDDGVGSTDGARPRVVGSGRSILDAVIRVELGGRVEYVPADNGTHVRLTFPRASA